MATAQIIVRVRIAWWLTWIYLPLLSLNLRFFRDVMGLDVRPNWKRVAAAVRRGITVKPVAVARRRR